MNRRSSLLMFAVAILGSVYDCAQNTLPPYLFAAAQDPTREVLPNTADGRSSSRSRFSQVKGEEKQVTLADVWNRDLAKKKNNANATTRTRGNGSATNIKKRSIATTANDVRKKNSSNMQIQLNNGKLGKKTRGAHKQRGANQAKKRSNLVISNNVQKKNNSNMQLQPNNGKLGKKTRGAHKQRGGGNNQKKKTRTTNKKKATPKKTRTSNKKKYKDNKKETNKKDKDKKDKGKKNKGKGKKKKPNNKPSSAGIIYYPNFDIMACISDGMPPSYLSPVYFSTSSQECCTLHFAGLVADCITNSLAIDAGMDGGGYIVAINQQQNYETTAVHVASSGKSGKSGGTAWMGGKASKTGGKAGKAVEVANPWGGSSLTNSVGNSLNNAWAGGSTQIMSPIGSVIQNPWGSAWILQTEEPTYYPSYMPTLMPTTYAPTSYMPTTYHPTAFPTTMLPTELPTEQENNVDSLNPTSYPPTSSTYFPTTMVPTFGATATMDDDDKGTGKSLYKGSGDGTYYYDITGKFCPQDSQPYAENDGYPTCTSFDKSKWMTLEDYDTNNIVAIDRKLLSTEKGRQKYCGKEIKVFKDGKQVKGGPFVVFDGCKACEGGKRIDFSLSALDKIDNGQACENGVVDGISWEVVDNQIMKFVP